MRSNAYRGNLLWQSGQTRQAPAALEVIPDYVGEFKVIEFAVYCRPDDLSNYRVFDRTLWCGKVQSFDD